MQIKLTLVINSAEGRLQVILGRTNKNKGLDVVLSREFSAVAQGAELLIPELSELLSMSGAKIENIERIACVRGPGSFTGIRLGLTTAFGLARAISDRLVNINALADKKLDNQKITPVLLAGLDYLPSIAATASLALNMATSIKNSLCSITDSSYLQPVFPISSEEVAAKVLSPNPLWVLTHARSNLINIQGFMVKQEDLSAAVAGLEILTEPLALSLEEAAEFIKKESKIDSVFLCGLGLRRHFEFFKEKVETAFVLPEFIDQPAPPILLNLAAIAEYSLNPIEPLYLRPCEAEENLPKIAANLGLEPEDAVERLNNLTKK